MASTPSRARRRSAWERTLLSLLVFAVAILAVVFARDAVRERASPPPAPSTGLPQTPDYHALLVDPTDAQRLLLGTHVGVYESADGGRTWKFAALSGKDAMNLIQSRDGTVWAAGHDLLAKSSDGGRTWTEVRAAGLPSYDIHAFATSRAAGRIYAAVAGHGLYRSDDGGKSFRLISEDVGPDVTALAVTHDGVVWAGDGANGVLVNGDGEGREWVKTLDRRVLALAASPVDADTLLATSGGVLLTANDGRTWKTVRPIREGAGPVAWAPSDPDVAYAVGLDRELYRTDDRGSTWRPVQ